MWVYMKGLAAWKFKGETGHLYLLKFYRKLRKMFLSPRQESKAQPSDLRRDALTIELPGLRWQRGYDVYRFVHAT